MRWRGGRFWKFWESRNITITYWGNLCQSLGLTADNLDLGCLDLLRVVELELDILEYKGPDFIAEPVRVQMTLRDQVRFCMIVDLRLCLP